MKLLRTIRLDPSDTFVFDRAAEPGEWAAPGAFVFLDRDPQTLVGKARVAFRSGFLGVQSLGFSTLCQVVNVSEEERRTAIEILSQQLIAAFGAPSAAAARAAAEEEFAFAASLCEHPAGTVIAMRRVFEDGEIRETFRTLRPAQGSRPLRAFAFLEVEGEEEEDGRDDIDIVSLAQGERR